MAMLRFQKRGDALRFLGGMLCSQQARGLGSAREMDNWVRMGVWTRPRDGEGWTFDAARGATGCFIKPAKTREAVSVRCGKMGAVEEAISRLAARPSVHRGLSHVLGAALPLQ
jgi:hypothetical protein